ncbi:hypothetical protein FRC08_014160, partial [Ceratobasidium sp. 394]
YFYLWLERYRTLHQSWASSVLPSIPSSSIGGYRPRDLWERLNPCQDRTLKQEFAYAKANWLDKRASARLDLSDEMRRGVLNISNLPPQETGSNELTHQLPSFPNQPSPARFDPILAHILHALRAAFGRFTRLAFVNGGLFHACLSHLGGSILFLAPGLALWCLGVSSGGRRGLVAGSLPLIWMGLWVLLMASNGHCFAIWVTGDARQLYPHELVRPLAPEQEPPPPVYSLDIPPQADDTVSIPVTPSSPEHRFGISRRTSTQFGRETSTGVGRNESMQFGRKESTQLGSRTSEPRLGEGSEAGRKVSEPRLGRNGSEPRLGQKRSESRLGRKESEPGLGQKGSEAGLGRKESEPRLGRKFSLASRRGSLGFLGMFGRKAEGEDQDDAIRAAESGMAIEMDTRRTMVQAREMHLKLPPARKTKDLPIRSLAPDALPEANSYPVPQQDWTGLRPHWEDEATSTVDITEYRFTEAEDFGIVVSDAYEADEDYYPHLHPVRTLSAEGEGAGGGGAGASGGEESVPGSSTVDKPLVSLQVQVRTPTPVPENTPRSSSRRGALPDIFSFGTPPPTPSSARKSKSNPALDWVMSQARTTPPNKSPDVRRGSRHDLEAEDDPVALMNPRWRTMFGPMTLIHDPLVRRAQWALTVRCWMVAGVVACGMSLGLIR